MVHGGKLPGSDTVGADELGAALGLSRSATRHRGVGRLGRFARAAVRSDAALNEEIIALRAELERRTAAGEDATELREAILGARRLLRDGLSLRVGDVFATRYRLDMLAGTGGFASVWKAWDNVDKTMVAVKVLHHQWTADRSRVERFFSGARQMAKL